MPDHEPGPDLLLLPIAHSLQRRRLLRGLAAAPLFATLAACGGRSSDEAVAPSAEPAATDGSFTHPGLLHTDADFMRMREQVAAGAQPWTDGWNALTRSSRAQLGRSPIPLATVVRGGDGENFRTMVEDMLRAYQYALRWKVSGDTAYADAAVNYLDAWSSTLTALAGNADRFLAAGLYGYQWANAAEIMRTYDGWSNTGIERFQRLLLEVFYPLSHDFLIRHNDSNITNYWANWDLCALSAILAIGVFCDRRDLYDEALAYYRQGRGNGAASHAVYCLHPGHLGQWQESARDQGHSTLGMALAGSLCEMAWNQGDDLFGHLNNRLLAGAEYVAAANFADADGGFAELPFSTYVNRQGTFTAVSAAGQPHLRPCWELIYHHYVNRRGLSAPHVAALAARLRPEADQWIGDHPSHGTLTFTRAPIGTGAAPGGATAIVTGGAVQLSWWGSADATAYEVQRSASASGGFAAIATVGEPRTHTDAPGDGTWYYRVAALAGGEPRIGTQTLRVALPGELILHLPLADGGGATAADTSGLGRHAQLADGASWGAGRGATANALALDGQGGHLVLPAAPLQGLGDFTLALWVHWDTAATHTRLVDIGSSDIDYLALEPSDGSGRLRFMISGTHYFGEQAITAASALPTGRWVHVAVTLRGTQGRLYVDGAEAGRNDTITFAPFQLGPTTQNWLGRSQYAADPAFAGRMQDLRVYSGALSAEQIAALAA